MVESSKMSVYRSIDKENMVSVYNTIQPKYKKDLNPVIWDNMDDFWRV